jgi:uncharacterized protein (UPF0548 family)
LKTLKIHYLCAKIRPMKATLRFPTPQQLHANWQRLAARHFTYAEQGATQGAFPPGYDHDRNRICIGEGPAAFEAGKAALRDWRHFPAGWTHIYPVQAELQEGQDIVMLFRLFGLWWHNACRIVYIIDEPRRFGFAYGTVVGHVECGEELFLVSMDEEGNVWYQLEAFSRPAIWATRLAYLLARHHQRRFARQSLRQMLEAGQSLVYV